MKQIAQHIAYLLLTCRKVNVAGLGCFTVVYEKAKFDLQHQQFYPSRFRIRFYPEANTSKSRKASFSRNLLEESLERRLKIDEKDAVSLIENFVNRIQTSISRKNYCHINGIGYLIKDNIGNLTLKDTFWKLNEKKVAGL